MIAYPLVCQPWLRQLRARFYRLASRTRIHRSGTNRRIDLGDALLHRCRIELSGRGHTLIIHPGARLWDVTLRFTGENHTVIIGPHTRLRGGHFIIEDSGGRLEIGARTEMFAPMIVCSEGGTIRIGRDCLAAYGTDIRNSDGHSILDNTTRQRINPAADIVVADHSWLGNHCQITKGVAIGPHSIVGARAVVTKDLPPHTLAAGIPARILRENIDWDPRRL